MLALRRAKVHNTYTHHISGLKLWKLWNTCTVHTLYIWRKLKYGQQILNTLGPATGMHASSVVLEQLRDRASLLLRNKTQVIFFYFLFCQEKCMIKIKVQEQVNGKAAELSATETMGHGLN
jgi:hypothetical protein